MCETIPFKKEGPAPERKVYLVYEVVADGVEFRTFHELDNVTINQNRHFYREVDQDAQLVKLHPGPVFLQSLSGKIVDSYEEITYADE